MRFLPTFGASLKAIVVVVAPFARRERLHCLAFLCLCSTGFLCAQGTFIANVSSREVVVGDLFEVSYTLFNADGADFKAPTFPNCRVVSGPNEYKGSKVVQGRISRYLMVSYRLLPLKVGTIRIEPASITVYRETLKTQPIVIKVSPESTKPQVAPANGDKDVFIVAEPAVREAYVGQQVALNFKVYTSVDLTSITPISEPKFTGFFREDIANINDDTRRVPIGGRNYICKTIKRMALFPQQEGTFNIEELALQVGVRSPQTGMLVPRTIRSAPVNIKVLPLPDGAPTSFSGAVGIFEMEATLSASSVSTDDAVTLTIALHGDGDIHRVQPPAITWPPALEVYDPKIADDNTLESQGMLQGRKSIEYTILPKQVGTCTLTPEFSYFDPFQRKYIRLLPKVPNLEVTQGTKKSQAEAAKTNQQGLFLPNKTSINFAGNRRPFVESNWFWVLIGIPLLGLGVALGHRRLQLFRSRLDATLVRRKRAGGIAQKKLDTVKIQLTSADVRTFCQAISNALYGYVADKLNMPPSAFTKDNIRERLTTHGASDTAAEGVLRLLSDCELAIFAGQGNALNQQAMYERTENIIDTLERELI